MTTTEREELPKLYVTDAEIEDARKWLSCAAEPERDYPSRNLEVATMVARGLKALSQIPDYETTISNRDREIDSTNTALHNATESASRLRREVWEAREVLVRLRAFRGVWLHDAECFSVDGSKPCVCGRESLVAAIDEFLVRNPAPTASEGTHEG